MRFSPYAFVLTLAFAFPSHAQEVVTPDESAIRSLVFTFVSGWQSHSSLWLGVGFKAALLDSAPLTPACRDYCQKTIQKTGRVTWEPVAFSLAAYTPITAMHTEPVRIAHEFATVSFSDASGQHAFMARLQRAGDRWLIADLDYVVFDF